MKILTGLFSIAIVGAGLIASTVAQADTVYHRVYRQGITATDPFSLLDEHQNNALRPVEYNKGGFAPSFAAVDRDDNGFVTRSEFYGTSDQPRTMRRTARVKDVTLIEPAAGGPVYTTTTTYAVIAPKSDIVYHNDPCDNDLYRHDPSCR